MYVYFFKISKQTSFEKDKAEDQVQFFGGYKVDIDLPWGTQDFYFLLSSDRKWSFCNQYQGLHKSYNKYDKEQIRTFHEFLRSFWQKFYSKAG